MIKAAFDLAPADALYVQHLDWVLVEKLADPRQAITLLESAMGRDPGNARARERLGYLYGFMEEHERAGAHYRRAAELAPRDPGPQEGLGRALGEPGRFDEAVAAYRRAMALAPRWAAPHLGLAYLLGARYRMREAIAEFERDRARLGRPPPPVSAPPLVDYLMICRFADRISESPSHPFGGERERDRVRSQAVPIGDGELPGNHAAEHRRLEDTHDRPERGVRIAAREGEGELSGSDGAVDLARASIQVAIRVGELRPELVVRPRPLHERRQRRDDEVLDERWM